MALQFVRKKYGLWRRPFLAYMAIDEWSQEPTWYRPRWWGGETAYWKEDIEKLELAAQPPAQRKDTP